MNGDLYHRLKLLKKMRQTVPSRAPSPPRKPAMPLGVPGFTPLADGVWSRVLRMPALQLREVLTDASILFPAQFSPEQVRFFDLETTGLSGGAGTKVFLAGVARLEGDTLALEQLLLTEYGAEPAYLTALAERFPQDALYISYNGKAFDAHQLKTRFVLNGRTHVLQHHFDLLYPARRLWRSVLPGCSLSELERYVLETERDQDLPSWEVPERYFEFLRDGDPAVLQPVIAHHYHDILSLTKLLMTVHAILSDPRDWIQREAVPFDVVQAAAWLLHRGRGRAEHKRAEEMLRQVVFHTGRDPVVRTRAGLLLGAQYKYFGRWTDAEGVWRLVFEQFGELKAGVELAKLLEHRRRDPNEALQIVLALQRHQRPPTAARDLAHRELRLRRKLNASDTA